MINVRHLCVTFGAVRVLDGLDVDLAGPVTGLIGPNGAGKTTFLNAISGAVMATGSVRLDGEELLGVRAYERARRGIRRTFQSALLVDDLTVAQNVMTGLDNHSTIARLDRADRVSAALRTVGLSDLASTQASRLRNIERRLVGLARATAASPKLLLLDEPGAGLLAEEKDRLVEAICHLIAVGDTEIVLIEHDMDLISRVCPDVVVLNFGQLLAQGRTVDVLTEASVRAAYLGKGS